MGRNIMDEKEVYNKLINNLRDGIVEKEIQIKELESDVKAQKKVLNELKEKRKEYKAVVGDIV